MVSTSSTTPMPINAARWMPVASPNWLAMIDARVSRLDAVVVTHAHADHLHGIDDLRSVNRLMKSPIPLYADGKLYVCTTSAWHVLQPTKTGVKPIHRLRFPDGAEAHG